MVSIRRAVDKNERHRDLGISGHRDFCTGSWLSKGKGELMKKTADVVIIGGGCMGASVAYHLTRNGVEDVVLLERDRVLGTGSTGRNAGGVRHQFSHDANVRLSLESIRCFENFEEAVGFPIDFHQDGYLFLVSSEEAWKEFQVNAERQRALGVEVELLSPEEARDRAPGLAIEGAKGATFCGADGIADPAGVTQGFARAAQSKGLEVLLETEVRGLELAGDRIRGVVTDRGTIETSTVVNAAGPWARQVGEWAGLDIPVLPYRRHLYFADVPQGPGRPPIPQDYIMVIDFETSFYFHREGPHLLFGMGDPNETPCGDLSVDESFIEQVIPVAVSRLPALEEASLVTTWAGLYEVTPDAMPILGMGPVGGFFMINGFSGHGFQHAPAAGRIVADLIAGREPGMDLSPFSFARFDGEDVGGERNFI